MPYWREVVGGCVASQATLSRCVLESSSVLSEHARDGRRALPEQVLAIGVVTTSLTMWPWCVWCGSLVA